VQHPSEADASAHTFCDALTDELRIGGDDAHHLVRVRRLQPGEVVTVADGRGAWRRYEVAATLGGALTLASAAPVCTEPPLRPALTVAFAITKRDKPEQVVRQLTELGVDRIRPSFSARAVPRWDDTRATRALDRYTRVAREAAAQCRRARLPVVDTPAPLAALAGAPGLVVADRAGAAAPPETGDGWTLVVGPEGGLTADELAHLGDPPRLSAGPHVLRADTAAVASAALFVPHRGHAAPDGHTG
jgi:16S rRNA (uracil1498-N3)-methyltransferase